MTSANFEAGEIPTRHDRPRDGTTREEDDSLQRRPDDEGPDDPDVERVDEP